MGDDACDVYLLRELFAHLRLWQVGGHDDGVLAAVGHLVQVVENAGVALVEAHALWEEHRGVAMGVEREDAVVQAFGPMECRSFVDEPLEEWQTVFAEPFGMPLYGEDGLELVALDGFDDTVGCLGRDAESGTGGSHSLMMERVDKQPYLGLSVRGLGLTAIEVGQIRVGRDGHAVCRLCAVGIL